MSETVNGQAAIGPPPVAIVAGHLTIWDDTAAGRGHVLSFRRDDSDEVIYPQLPPIVLPLLAKVLRGDEISAGDLPGGPAVRAMLKRVVPDG